MDRSYTAGIAINAKHP